MKVTSTTSLCTQLPGSCHAWDVSARLGLHTGSGKGEPEDNSAGAGGGEDSETQRLGCWKIREQGGCRPRENREGRTGRLGHRVLPGKQSLHASRHQTRLSRAQSGPMRTGRIGRSAPSVAHSPAPGAAGGRRRRGEGARSGWDLCARAASSGNKHCKQAPRHDTPSTSSGASCPLAFDPRPHVASKWTPTVPAPLVTNP